MKKVILMTGIFVFVLSAISSWATAASVSFEDNFDGSSIDAAKWNNANATGGQRWCDHGIVGDFDGPGEWVAYSSEQCQYTTQPLPFGSIDVSDGYAHFSSLNSRAFPYISIGPPDKSPFPTSGDFTVELRMRYDAFTIFGDGFVVLSWLDSTPTGTNNPGGNANRIFSIWAGSSGITSSLFGQEYFLYNPYDPNASAFHTYNLEYKAGTYSIYVDGVLEAGPVNSNVMPNAMWLGNPIAAYWWPDNWTGFSIDYIKITTYGGYGQFDPNIDGYNKQNYGYDLLGWSDSDRWQAFKDAFGDGCCELNGQPTIEAQTYFDANKTDILSEGHCFGFSVSSLRFFTKEWNVNDPLVVGAPVTKVNDIPWYLGSAADILNVKIANKIEAGQWQQRAYTNFYHANDPKKICEELESNFINGNSNPAEITIGDTSPDCTGLYWLSERWLCQIGLHSLVPYKTERLLNTCKIYVYDSNSPNPKDTEQKYITVDMQNNTWSYIMYRLGWGSSETWSGPSDNHLTIIALRTYSDIKNKPIAPFGSGLEGFPHHLVGTGPSAVMIQDTLFRRLGIVNGKLINEIPGAIPIFTSAGSMDDGSAAQNYAMPDGSQFNTFATGVDTGSYSLTDYAPRGLLRVETASVPGSTDILKYDAQNNSGSFSTQDADKSIRLILVRSVPTLTIERVLEVNMNSTPGLSVSEKMSTDFNSFVVHVEGSSSSNRYGLKIRQIGLGAGEFKYDNISILPGDTQIIIPENWDDLTHTKIMIQVDHGSDGVIDEILIITSNRPPVASAGPDQTFERISAAGAAVTLNGSGSSDPDGDALTYSWTWGGGSASGIKPTVIMPMGLTAVTLTVSDGKATSTANVNIRVVDTTPPTASLVAPNINDSVQDGVLLAVSASDLSGVTSVRFYVRGSGGASGVPIGEEDLAGTFNAATGNWEFNFDSTQLQDGYYVVLAKATDTYANEGWSKVVSFSIRNWAVVKLLPATQNNSAGRTMPVKFSIRVASNVDPNMPFVYNEDLEVRIFKSSDPTKLLQASRFGSGSTSYRIDTISKQYLTNFKTLATPASYTIEIWRYNKNWKVGSFTFNTSK